jgi:tetratricopeptide (TPR) repeat protein
MFSQSLFLNIKDYFNAGDTAYIPNENYKTEIKSATECINNSLIIWPETYVYRGTCYLRQGDFAKAIADAEQAVSCASRDSTIFMAHVFRGNVHYAMQDYNKAIADYRHALNKTFGFSYISDDKVMICRYNLMYAYYKKKQVVPAINAFCNALLHHKNIPLNDAQRTNANNILKEMLFSINEHTNLDSITTGENLFYAITCLYKEDQILFLQQSALSTTPLGKKMHHLQKEILEHLQKLGCDVSAFHHANVSVTTVGMYPNLTAASKSKIKEITSDELFNHSNASTAHNSL